MLYTSADGSLCLTIRKKISSTLLLLLCFVFVQAQSDFAAVRTPRKILDGFMEKRFGMFIHYGPVTLRGTEIGWSRGKQVATVDYDNLYKEFNPVLFNADAWVKAAKDAGMQYLTIVAKHHDGFCLWPTAYSPYNIGNTPFKRDITGELATACKKYGITFCIYFTVLDWHDADYPAHSPHDSTDVVKGDMIRFVGRMKNELKELITRYHPYMLWFDGNWEKYFTQVHAEEVYRYIKSIDRNVIISNRLGNDGNSKLTDHTIGDFLTPEQVIGGLNMKDPWESCITIAQQWAWKPNDDVKSTKECIQTLAKTSGGNGNLLLNVSPMLDGRLEDRQVKRLQEVGQWLKVHGAAIYSTKGGPFPVNDFFATTRKGNKLYLHILNRKMDVLSLPALPGVAVTKAYFMEGGAAVKFTAAEGYKIVLPAVLPDKNVSVIVLELDKNAEELPVITQ